MPGLHVIGWPTPAAASAWRSPGPGA